MSLPVNNISNGFSGFAFNIPPSSSNMIGDYIAGLVTIISLLVLFYGIIKYFIARKDKNAVNQAQKIILYGLIGLFIIGIYYAFTIVIMCCVI